MPGISSQNTLLASIAAGQNFRADWNKNFLPTTAAVGGEWHCLARGGGNPAADAIYNTGTNLTFQAVSDTTTSSGGILHGGSVQPTFYKQLTGGSAFTAAPTTAPCVLMLVDLVGFYRLTTVTTAAPQAMTNTLGQTNTFTVLTNNILTHTAYNVLVGTRVRLTTTGTLPTGLATATDYYVIKLTDTTMSLATSYANAIAGTEVAVTSGTGSGTHTLNWLLPRYTNGAGVQCFIWNNNATAMGAATPTMQLDSYTNSAQATGRATPTLPSLPIGKTAGANGLVLYSGTGIGKYGPFMPLQSGDAGIAQINSFDFSVSYVSGEMSLGLCKPLATFPITTLGVAAERDFVYQIPSLPRIYDGANLIWLMYSGVNTPINSAMFGHLDFVWS